MDPSEPAPVKLLCGLLYSSLPLMERAVSIMERCWGTIDYMSSDFPFDVSDYYNQEMGTPILRRFISFEALIQPGRLAGIKLACNEIEQFLAERGSRQVNLDPGYLDFDKIILASAKYNGQKIYLGNGIWADLTLSYCKGRVEPYAWSFPDFRSGRYNETLLQIRTRYKRTLTA